MAVKLLSKIKSERLNIFRNHFCLFGSCSPAYELNSSNAGGFTNDGDI